jgi:hypothetical protein
VRKKLFNKKFDYAKPFMNGCAFVFENNKWDIILEDGNSICDFLDNIDRRGSFDSFLNCLYNPLDSLDDQVFVSTIIKNYLFDNFFILTIDISKFLTEFDNWFPSSELEFLHVLNKRKNYAYLVISDKFEFVYSDTYEEILIFEDVGFLNNNLIPVKLIKGDWIYFKTNENTFEINQTNWHVSEALNLDTVFDDLSPDCRVINGMGYMVFDEAYSFSDGIAKIKLFSDDKYSYIKKDGRVLVNNLFDECSSFYGGYACVAKNEINSDGHSVLKWNIIDKFGNFIFNKYFVNASIISANKFIVKDIVYCTDYGRNKRSSFVYYLTDSSGNIIFKIQEKLLYNYLDCLSNNEKIDISEEKEINALLSNLEIKNIEELFSYQIFGQLNFYFSLNLYFNQAHKYNDKKGKFKIGSIIEKYEFEERPFRLEFDFLITEKFDVKNEIYPPSLEELKAEHEEWLDAQNDLNADRMYRDEIDSWDDDWNWNID